MIVVDTSALIAILAGEPECPRFGRYGKGINPKARLNLGDCASYALAKSFDAPLLFKGADFAATDVVAAE